jgi:hypothetical protein
VIRQPRDDFETALMRRYLRDELRQWPGVANIGHADVADTPDAEGYWTLVVEGELPEPLGIADAPHALGRAWIDDALLPDFRGCYQLDGDVSYQFIDHPPVAPFVVVSNA